MKFSLLIPVLINYVIIPVENLGFLTGVLKSTMQKNPALKDKSSNVYLDIFFPKVKESCLFTPIRRDDTINYDAEDADLEIENEGKEDKIHPDDRVLLSECENLVQKINFKIGARTVLILPGIGGTPDRSSIQVIIKAYLKRCDHYVIVLNWINMTGRLTTPYKNGRIIAHELGKCFNSLEKEGYNIADNLHIVGFSIGGLMAGTVGHDMKKKPLRITGLDPVRIPLSQIIYKELKLSPSDAQFVDVIHTDMYYYGVGYPSGHVDFLVNSGRHPQPGCEKKQFSLCNHATAVFVYAEAVTQIPKDPTLLARPCNNWKNFINGLCDQNIKTIIMGPDLDTRHSGVFCLHTNASFNKVIGKGIKGSFGKDTGHFSSDSPSLITQVEQINYQPDEGDEEDEMMMGPRIQVE
ncbi:phospholipase A1 member A-like isoform X2 [Lycorma delicatula]